MLAGAIFVVLGLFPAYATGQLMTTKAKCLPGYEWTFNTLNQSPCDVAASLGAVCSPTGQYDLDLLPTGYVYSGPPTEFANSCRCSSVYYSMLSACGYCQGRQFRKWSEYRTNCSTVSLQSYTQPLPSGVNVPAWAYLNVLDGDNFNITLAQRTRGTESSRLSATPTSTTSSPTPTGSRTNIGAIAGGVAGGVVLIIIALITIFCLCKRRTRTKTSANSQSQLPAPRPDMISPNQFFPPSELNNFDSGVVEPPMWPQQSPLAPSLITHFTGSSGRQTVHPQRMMTQPRSDISPTQYTMVPQNENTMFTPHETNTMFTPHEQNTMAPTRMLSAQSLSHQIRNTALPALGQYTSQSVTSALPRQNSTQNSIPTPFGHNLEQSVISMSDEQSSTQDMISTSTSPSQKKRQDTIPFAEEMPPPQYTAHSY